ncbi:MAG: hypothetical protein ACOX5J_00065 [Candidatus Hydrogenedentales bacterium]
MAVTLPVLWGMVLAGPEFIRFRVPAGVLGTRDDLLQLLACGSILSGMAAPVEVVFLAVGDSFRHFLTMLSRSATLLLAMGIGGWLNGSAGIIWGVVLAPALQYPFLSRAGPEIRGVGALAGCSRAWRSRPSCSRPGSGCKRLILG